MSQLLLKGITKLTISFNSVQPGEGWTEALSNVNGSYGSFSPHSGGTDTGLTINTYGHRYIDIGASTNDVLLHSAVAPSPAPEPSSMLLFGSGLIGMGGLLRRKCKLG